MSYFPLYPASLSAALLHPFVPGITLVRHTGVFYVASATYSADAFPSFYTSAASFHLFVVIKDAAAEEVNKLH